MYLNILYNAILDLANMVVVLQSSLIGCWSCDIPYLIVLMLAWNSKAVAIGRNPCSETSSIWAVGWVDAFSSSRILCRRRTSCAPDRTMSVWQSDWQFYWRSSWRPLWCRAELLSLGHIANCSNLRKALVRCIGPLLRTRSEYRR